MRSHLRTHPPVLGAGRAGQVPGLCLWSCSASGKVGGVVLTEGKDKEILSVFFLWTPLYTTPGMTPGALVIHGKVTVLGWASLDSCCRHPDLLPCLASRGLTAVAGVRGSVAPTVRQACASPQAPCVGKGGQVLFTESQPGSTREEEALFPLILPPPFGLPCWQRLRPRKGWEFGKVKVCHCLYLPLQLISLLRKPRLDSFSTQVT